MDWETHSGKNGWTHLTPRRQARLRWLSSDSCFCNGNLRQYLVEDILASRGSDDQDLLSHSAKRPTSFENNPVPLVAKFDWVTTQAPPRRRGVAKGHESPAAQFGSTNKTRKMPINRRPERT